VSLQPFEFDPAEKNRHKFMVQSMFAPEGEVNQETLWRESDASVMMDSKLKCVFVMPNEEANFNAAGEEPKAAPAPASASDYADVKSAPQASRVRPSLRFIVA